MLTAKLFARCPMRSKAIAKGLPWLYQHQAMVKSWAYDLGIDQALVGEAINKDLASDTRFVDTSTLWKPRQHSSGRSPRIGFLSAAYMPIGGTETFHRTLLPRLRNVVDIAGFVATGFYGGDGTKLCVPYATGMDAARLLAAHCDILISWGIDELADLLPRQRPKVIAVHHADWSSIWSNDSILNQMVLIDEIVAVNADVVDNLNGCGKPVHYIPNAIDPARITPSGEQSTLRSQHGIAQDSKIVLFGHRLSTEKRPDLAIEIACRLPPDWTMVIAGDGPMRHEVKTAAADCDRVLVIGSVDSLADWLTISDCFLSLSTFEGFGLAICEAMALGVPVVSTPTGIAPGLATTLPTDATIQQWAQAIVTAKPKVSRELIAEAFSVDQMVAGWLKVVSNPGMFNLHTASEHSACGKLKEWVLAYLATTEHVDLRKSFVQKQQTWNGPLEMDLSQLTRVSGPDTEDVFWPEPAGIWHSRVSEIAETLSDSSELPPILAHKEDGRILIDDGNHRVAAMILKGWKNGWVLLSEDSNKL
jgi:glycosyltransferase involved in cell wall biosynthesis